MNQLSQQIQHPTKRKRRQSNKRDGRSFWQPDGTKEVRKLSSEEWLGLWQTPPPTETTATWRYAMNSQKQAILQRHRMGIGTPAKRKPRLDNPIQRLCSLAKQNHLPLSRLMCIRRVNLSPKLSLGRPFAPFATGFDLNHTPKPPHYGDTPIYEYHH